MHPRLSFNSLCHLQTTLEQDLAIWRDLGATCVGLPVAKLEAAGWQAGIDAVRRSGFHVSTLLQPVMFHLDDRSAWGGQREVFIRTLDAGRQLGADSVYTISGRRGDLGWEEAAQAFVEAVRPVAAHARSIGVPLLIEQTPALYVEMSFVNTLRDALRVAEMADIGVCLDIWHCWTEPDLKANIQRAVPRSTLVQVSDYTVGDRSLPCRSVPGDGVIPLERIIGWMLEAGYEGAFDSELIGPRIDAEGALPALRRSGEYMSALLGRLGA